jgi:hypothetical protein
MSGYRRAIAVVTLCTTTACYTTVPLESFPPAVGSDVVVMLTDVGSTAMASVVGPRVRGVSGRSLGVAGDSLLLSVKTVIKQDGNEEFWRGERVAISHSDVATVGGRHFSALKSGAIVGVVVAALVGISSVVFTGHAGTKINKPPPPQ